MPALEQPPAPSSLVAQASDPNTPQGTLGSLAAEWPSLRPAIATNPNAYDGLLDWLALLGDPHVDAALAARYGIVTPSTVTEATEVTGWREPARQVPLRWGTYELRYGITLGAFATAALITVAAQASFGWISDYRIAFWAPIVLGLPLVLGGWVSIPAPANRRVLASLTSLLAFFPQLAMILGAFYGGVLFTGIAASLVITAWLIARSRPGVTYLFGLIPVLLCVLDLLISRGQDQVFLGTLWWETIGSTFYDPTSGSLEFPNTIIEPIVFSLFVLSTWAILVVAPLWLARTVAKARGEGSPSQLKRAASVAALTEQRNAHAEQLRVTQIQEWERAYAIAHNGERPPAGFMPPIAVGNAGVGTNTMAILALIFGIGGGLLGIIFGHVARSQIRRTGEQGWGLATVGLVFGYIALASYVALAIFYVVLLLL